MPGRFKLSGNWYVSEWGGNNANAGTDPLLPKATIANVPNSNGVVVIGAGVYKENAFGSAIKTMQGDGLVIIDGLGGSLGLANTSVWKNIWIKNASNLGHLLNASANTDNIYENVAAVTAQNNFFAASRSIFLPSTVKLTNGFITTISCIILEQFNMSQTSNVWTGCFIAKNITWVVSATETFAAGNFDNACINGKISRNGILYESKKLWDGSARPDADPGILDIIDVFPNFYARGNFACVDPEFLDLFSKIVKPTSPLLKRSHGGYFVGAVRPGKFVPITDPAFQVTFTRMNTSNPDSAVVSAGQNDGTVRMTGRISESLVSSRFLGVRSILQFWKGAAGGTGENNNVPDAVKLLGLLPAEIDRPRRLTYLMRTSLDPNANQSSPDSIWDNNGATAGQYLLFEINTAPAHVGSPSGTLGNGDPRATGGAESPFNFRSVDIIFLLDNDRD
ncbi:MAG: hypothetical protein ACK4SF_04355 [Algoriphagus aquaeductus]|uniref:hypothetical protein n=1 Tax=Algoriphagus aquaeductus TaxID=475299 RepID=UPI00391D7C04